MPSAVQVLGKYAAKLSPEASTILFIHSTLVTNKALVIAREYLEKNPSAKIDITLLRDMALVHDIGVVNVKAPDIGLHGEHPYITHIIHGKNILDSEELSHLSNACLNHTGISAEEVETHSLPLPVQDYLPQTIEEEILNLADSFYSKDPESLFEEKSIVLVRSQLEKWGEGAVSRFDKLCEKYLE